MNVLWIFMCAHVIQKINIKKKLLGIQVYNRRVGGP